MSTYLIDFENVKSGGLAGIDRIRKEDSVHLFWSARENKISIEMMEMIRSSESEIVMHKAVTGERDALDHQLCSYLGFLAGAKGETDFVIVSNDKAYDHLIEFWRRMNDNIHIQRVSEISRVSEAAKEVIKEASSVFVLTADAAAETKVAAAEENVVLAGKMVYAESESAEAETAATESRSGRNYRRRERGGKYLKGGRTGRGSRRNNYAEERFEEEKMPGQIKETAAEAEYVPEPIKEAAAETGYTPEPVKEAAAETGYAAAAVQPQTEISPAAYVVTGIKTVLVESGFTADGILDKRNSSSKSEQTEKTSTGKKEVEVPQTFSAQENAGREEKQPEKELNKEEGPVPEEKPESEEGKKPAAERRPDEKKKPAAEEKPDEKKKPAAEEKPDEKKKPAAEEKLKEEKNQVSEEKTEEKKSVPEEKTEEEPAFEAEKISEEKSGKSDRETVKKDISEEQGESEKKTRAKSARPAGRAKRGRPPKKEHTEHFPEIKIPIIASDVIAKCEEAADADWTGEVVRLINQSKDKKELYSAIVKLLGQEKGRTVYHAIKVLK